MKERCGGVLCYPTLHAEECCAAPPRDVTVMVVAERLSSARIGPPSVKVWLEEHMKWNERKKQSICGGAKVETPDIFKYVQGILCGHVEAT